MMSKSPENGGILPFFNTETEAMHPATERAARRKLHILISSIGTHGHVHPLIAAGQELMQRGHEVRFITGEYFREAVERAGLAFTPMFSTAQYLAAVQDTKIWRSPWQGVRASWRHLSPAMRQGYAALLEHLRPGESVLVGNSLAFWVRLAQEKFCNRAATVHFSPIAFLSADDPPAGILPGLNHLPAWSIRTLFGLIERTVTDPIICPDVNAFRASIGLAPIRSFGRRWQHSPDRVICTFPEWFAAPAPDWPVNTVCTGFAALPAGNQGLDPALEVFLAAGPAPIVFTPGSGVGSAQLFFARALETCQVLGRRAVLATPFRAQLPETLPDFAHHAAYAPYDVLSRRVPVFVHAGGIGTIGLLLAAGTKQLLTPFTAEQVDNAARAAALGAGLVLSPKASARQWAQTLSQLLESAAIAQSCARLAQTCAAAPRTEALIADWIEKLHPHNGGAPVA